MPQCVSRLPSIVLCLAMAAFTQPAFAQAASDAPRQVRPTFDPTSCSRPAYPEADAREKHAGITTMQFLIGPDGKVMDAKLQRSSGFRSLDRAALAALSKRSFAPATLDGKPTTAWAMVEYVWTPE